MPSNTVRIAKNTLMLYFRQLLIMLVSLYTVRVVLETLGAEDYGIYNVVGGVVAMFSFFNPTLTRETQRFLTFQLEKNNFSELKKPFHSSECTYTFSHLHFNSGGNGRVMVFKIT
jgi:hypothetical protein